MMWETLQCPKCRHRKLDVEDWPQCAAFPDGIPREILSAEHDHTEPYEGDHGIRFEPVDGEQEEPTE